MKTAVVISYGKQQTTLHLLSIREHCEEGINEIYAEISKYK